METVLERFIGFVTEVVNGKKLKHEITGFKEIAIFKTGSYFVVDTCIWPGHRLATLSIQMFPAFRLYSCYFFWLWGVIIT